MMWLQGVMVCYRLIGELFQKYHFSLEEISLHVAQILRKTNLEKAKHPLKHFLDFYMYIYIKLVTIESRNFSKQEVSPIATN